jgi:hypothetical protein
VFKSLPSQLRDKREKEEKSWWENADRIVVVQEPIAIGCDARDDK